MRGMAAVSMAREADDSGVLLAWTVHPARRRPRAALWASLYLLVVAGALQLGFRSPALTALGALLLLAACGDFWLPSHYRLTPDAALRERWLGRRSLAWAAVRAAAAGDEGVLLSEVAERGLARAFRSLWLPAAPEQGVTVAELVRWVDKMATSRVRPSQEESDEPR